MSRPNYRFLNQHTPNTHLPTNDSAFELNESDLYYSQLASSDSCTRPLPGSRIGSPCTNKQFSLVGSRTTSRPSSLPVNIPDWSKILREEYKENRRRDSLANDYFDDDDEEDEYDDDDGGGGDVYGGDGAARGRNIRLPPHEFLARQMARTRICCSFSVHEGVGRTLKGRDLSRVRNAILEKTGFQD